MLPTFICQPDETVITRAGKPQYPIRSIQTAAQWASYLETCQNTTLPSVATCTDATRAASMRQGFAFFDTFAFMDGPGSIHRWACQQPPLARFDHVHLTVDGYATVAQGLWAALLAKLPESAGLRRMDPLPSPSVDATLEEVDASP
jgi:lysophospholipase L1-like esterase